MVGEGPENSQGVVTFDEKITVGFSVVQLVVSSIVIQVSEGQSAL